MNPDLKQLSDASSYELIYTVPYKEMRAFVIRNISSHSLLLKAFSVFQVISLAIPFVLLSYELIMIYTQQVSWENFFMIMAGVIFSFSFLILIHELIHMLAFRILGKRGLRIGANLRQFIFFVEADKIVLNKREYLFIAILPFVLVLFLGISLGFLFWNDSIAYFFICVGAIHSLFCAGDMAIISLMFHESKEMYTFDDAHKQTAYFYRKMSDES